MIRWAARLVFIAAMLALAGGFGGALHPLGDSLAVFRWPLALICLATAVWLPRRLARFGALAALGVLLALAWPNLRGAWQGTPRLTLYQQNLLFSRTDDAAWLRAIDDLSPDVITLQEVSDRNIAVLDALAGAYPHQHLCRPGSFIQEAVLSRHPFVPGTAHCAPPHGLALVQIAAPKGPVWIGSVHLNWPWPYEQAPQVAQILPSLDRITGPAILAGDFNSVGWSHTVLRIAARSGTERTGRRIATFHLPFIALPVGIDHVLATGGGAVTRQPRLGSDHFGLFAQLNPWETQR